MTDQFYKDIDGELKLKGIAARIVAELIAEKRANIDCTCGGKEDGWHSKSCDKRKLV